MKTKQENKCPKCGAACETGRANVLGELRNSRIIKCPNGDWFDIIPPEHEPRPRKESETMDVANDYKYIMLQSCPKCHSWEEVSVYVSRGGAGIVTLRCTQCGYMLSAPAENIFDLWNAWNHGE